MGALKDFWNRIDAMAEEQRLKIPVWCVWDDSASDDVNADYVLYRCMTREEAVEKYKNEALDGHWDPSIAIHCRPATQKQIDEHRREEERWARAGVVPSQSPRLKMERV